MLFFGPFTPEFETHFLQSLHKYHQSKVLESTHILVPSNLLSLSLQRKWAQNYGSHSGVCFYTFLDLARRLLTSPFSFPPHFGPLWMENFLEQNSDRFEVFSDPKQCASALFHTCVELVDHGVAKVPPKNPKLQELDQIYQAFLQKNIMFSSELLLKAMENFDPLQIPRHLFVYGFFDATPLQKSFFQFLSKQTQLAFWVPVPSDDSPVALRFLLEIDEFSNEKELIDGAIPQCQTEVLNCPSAEAEAEEICARILQQPENKNCAILFRDAKTYHSIFQTKLEEARIPFYDQLGTSLQQTLLGKSLLQIFVYLQSSKKRKDLMNLLEVFPFTQMSESFSDWDRWTKNNSLLFVENSPHKIQSHPDGKRIWSFLTEVHQLSKVSTWYLLRKSILSLYEKFSELSEPLQEVLQILPALEQNWPCNSYYQKKIMQNLIENKILRNRHFEKGGVFLGSLAKSRHLRFDHVYAVGVVDGWYPKSPSQDPFFLDEEKKGLIRSVYNDEDWFDLLVSMANQSLCFSYSREGEKLPSPYLDQFSAPSYISMYPWQRDSKVRPSKPYFKKAEIFPSKELSQIFPLAHSSREWVDKMLGQPFWSKYEGLLPAEPHKKEFRFSAAQIQTFATCPYQYFFRYKLGLQKEEDPHDTVGLRALDRGLMIHDVLFSFFSQTREKNGFPLIKENENQYQNLLAKLVQDEFSKIEMGNEKLRNYEESVVVSDLFAYLKIELEQNLIPTAFEVRFGMDSFSEKEDQTYSTKKPVCLKVGDYQFELYGKIDRIDRSLDGKFFRVLDYKTGSLSKTKDDSFLGGQTIQLAVYLLALSVFFPENPLENTQAVMVSTSLQNGFGTTSFQGKVLLDRMDEFETILVTMADSIRKGHFIPTPGNQMEACRYCDFRSICTTNVGRRFEKKSRDPITQEILQLGTIA